MKVFGVVGYKNTGKTGLMERLVADITARGFSVSTIKHAHHSFDVDHAGKDSYRHRTAGASQVLLSSGTRWALMSELRGTQEPPLKTLLAQLDPVDLILIEGYKTDHHRKIETYRKMTKGTLLAPTDPTIIGVAADCAVSVTQPVFDLDDTTKIADFILAQVGL
ncbi:MAG: molybdopterin-guanine dinucleotide biosynthesis protein B [Rhodobacterales bacterium]|jgi:molybdopterin-guanine dinucleotide biosynthesis protein MobB